MWRKLVRRHCELVVMHNDMLPFMHMLKDKETNGVQLQATGKKVHIHQHTTLIHASFTHLLPAACQGGSATASLHKRGVAWNKLISVGPPSVFVLWLSRMSLSCIGRLTS